MKMAILATALLSTPAFAGKFSAEEKKCGRGVYCVEEMVCLGKIDGKIPRGMASGMVEVLTLKAAKTVTREQTLVDTLQMGTAPGDLSADITLEEAIENADFSYGNYGAPARVNMKTKAVTTKWSAIGFSSTGLNLEIISSEEKKGYRLDKLEGTEEIEGSVVGDFTMNYECQAKVVETPSLIIDQTTGK